jgi:uncharacterized Zn ribbon protein
MSNRVRSAMARALHKARPTCKMCRGRNVEVKEYDDATLFVCRECKYPWRKKKK